jgi:hypothetical protein
MNHSKCRCLQRSSDQHDTETKLKSELFDLPKDNGSLATENSPDNKYYAGAKKAPHFIKRDNNAEKFGVWIIGNLDKRRPGDKASQNALLMLAS